MSEPERRPRIRELGIPIGELAPGPLNAITDVPGVRVGHTTLIEGTDVRTGVTAIVPTCTSDTGGTARMSPRNPLPCGLFVGNGYGKLVGATQVAELGSLETPILLTATLSTFRVADALLGWLFGLEEYAGAESLNPVVGETNDGFLSDIRCRPITADHVVAALEGATGELPAEGCVGAGTGTSALGFKAGIGTASRRVDAPSFGSATVGALVQANFSGTLTIRGVPMPAAELLATESPSPQGFSPAPEPRGNSCMIVVATDAPLDARQLGRVARRAVFAMGRVGSDFAGSSGDYAIAFSTRALHGSGQAYGRTGRDDLDGIFRAAMEAVEEALLNSVVTATTTTGFRGHTRYALPLRPALERLHRSDPGLPSPGRLAP